ncbi:hypothetical protein OXYTRIMIC_796 [Oxytricha trifallax]|uniref:Uncharacterized protein n=1 Tax=Oxytricha trifallax TaxID=1172189 RepID=A0A073IB61_9SPIT|nr:hypothetical protein OXYTRIMIC_796 [Oxytricha trifallax]
MMTMATTVEDQWLTSQAEKMAQRALKYKPKIAVAQMVVEEAVGLRSNNTIDTLANEKAQETKESSERLQ